MDEKKIKAIIFINDDVSSNLIFSTAFDVSNVEVCGLCITKSLSKGDVGAFYEPFKLLKRCNFKYWFFLAFYNTMFQVQGRIFPKGSKSIKGFEVRALERICKERGIPVYFSPDFNQPSWLAQFASLKPDIFLIRINQIFSQALLDVPPLGTYCVHSSLLPSYKGIAAEFHSMVRGEKNIGSSIFKVTSKLDKGPVMDQVKLALDYRKSLLFNILNNNYAASRMLKAFMQRIRNREVKEGVVWWEFTPSYFSWPKTKEVNEFYKKKLKLFFKPKSSKVESRYLKK